MINKKKKPLKVKPKKKKKLSKVQEEHMKAHKQRFDRINEVKFI